MIDVPTIEFVVISALTIGAAIVSLESRNVVYGAIALAFTFLGLAGLFIILDATFVAMFQIIVNVGAVAVLILFTVMLVGEGRFFREAPNVASKIAGVIAAVVLAITLALSFVSSQMSNVAPQLSNSSSYINIGSLVTSQSQTTGGFAFTLEIIALVFGAALLGALTLAKLDLKNKMPVVNENMSPIEAHQTEEAASS